MNLSAFNYPIVSVGRAR